MPCDGSWVGAEGRWRCEEGESRIVDRPRSRGRAAPAPIPRSDVPPEHADVPSEHNVLTGSRGGNSIAPPRPVRSLWRALVQSPRDHKEAPISASSPTYREALDRLVRCAVVHQGAESLADLAGLSFESLLRQSGLEEVAGEIKLTPPPVGALFAQALNAVDDRRRVVALKRTYARNPEKLEELGREFGVSRERARQLEVGLRHVLKEEIGDAMAAAARWLRRSVGSAAETEEFDDAIAMLVGDAPEEVRSAAEVAVMQVADYHRLESGVGDTEFRELVDRVQNMTARFANAAGVVDEEQLMEAVGGAPRWELVVRNAGLARIGEYLAVRDTRRARVFVALEKLGEPVTRPCLAKAAGLADNTTLSSLPLVGSALRAPHQGQVGAAGVDRQPLRRRGRRDREAHCEGRGRDRRRGAPGGDSDAVRRVAGHRQELPGHPEVPDPRRHGAGGCPRPTPPPSRFRRRGTWCGPPTASRRSISWSAPTT